MEFKVIRCPSCSAVVRNLPEQDTEFIKCEYCGSTINMQEEKSEEDYSPKLLIDLAQVELSHQNYDKALSFISKILENNAEHKEALWLRFNILLHKYEGELFYCESEDDYNRFFDDDSDNPLKKYKDKAVKTLVNLFRISSENERKSYLRKLRKQDFSKSIFNSIPILEKLDDASNHADSEILSSLLYLYYQSALEYSRKKIPLSNKIKNEIIQIESYLKKTDSTVYSELNTKYLADLKAMEISGLTKTFPLSNSKKKRTPATIYLLLILIVLIIILFLFL